MSRAENVRTVAGLVNREVLGELKRGFDRRALLVLNHRLDQLRSALSETEPLRQELFRLHVLTNTVLDDLPGWPMIEGEPIGALAERLNTAMIEWGEVFAQGGALLDELARLAPALSTE